jgi:hypothetical protein
VAAVLKRIISQDLVKEASWDRIAKVKTAVSDAMERARKDSWREDWITGLSVFRSSLDLYLTTDRLLAVADFTSLPSLMTGELRGSPKVITAGFCAGDPVGAARASGLVDGGRHRSRPGRPSAVAANPAR